MTDTAGATQASGIREVMLFRDARGWGVTATLGARISRHWRCGTESQARFLAAVLELGPSTLPEGSSASRRHARVLGSRGRTAEAGCPGGEEVTAPRQPLEWPRSLAGTGRAAGERAPADRGERGHDCLAAALAADVATEDAEGDGPRPDAWDSAPSVIDGHCAPPGAASEDLDTEDDEFESLGADLSEPETDGHATPSVAARVDPGPEDDEFESLGAALSAALDAALSGEEGHASPAG